MTFAQRAESAWSKSFSEMEKLCKKLFQNVKNVFDMEALGKKLFRTRRCGGKAFYKALWGTMRKRHFYNAAALPKIVVSLPIPENRCPWPNDMLFEV